MTPALFALVDALWLYRWRQWRCWRSARRRLGFHEAMGNACEGMARSGIMLGWWRSLWPLGGGM